jgi:predicted RNA binding protein YcfA (HicA-like mRNA interferase family)
VTKLPTASGQEIIKFLSKHYNIKAVRSKGSHAILKSDDGRKTVVVPLHSTIDKGTLRSILISADIDIDEFIQEWDN